MEYKVNGIKQEQPRYQLQQLIDRAVGLGMLGEIDGFKAHRMMKEDRYIPFTHDLLMDAYNELARMQRYIREEIANG